MLIKFEYISILCYDDELDVYLTAVNRQLIRKLFNYADVSDLGWTPSQNSTIYLKNHL
jgi:hypothetical protein